jgi:hypothetical protein
MPRHREPPRMFYDLRAASERARFITEDTPFDERAEAFESELLRQMEKRGYRKTFRGISYLDQWERESH